MVAVEFFDAPGDLVVREGPFDWVHLEGRAIVAVTGDERTQLAALDVESWTWIDRRGVRWIDVAVVLAVAPRA
ncbi:hypothetical protein HY631_04635 [Candidatus Uhrbacteria bacterium]|nr:hypothetical protein [Candidatus Uhrbacteria bacterium]